MTEPDKKKYLIRKTVGVLRFSTVLAALFASRFIIDVILRYSRLVSNVLTEYIDPSYLSNGEIPKSAEAEIALLLVAVMALTVCTVCGMLLSRSGKRRACVITYGVIPVLSAGIVAILLLNNSLLYYPEYLSFRYHSLLGITVDLNGLLGFRICRALKYVFVGLTAVQSACLFLLYLTGKKHRLA